jgi:hypothetical protein
LLNVRNQRLSFTCDLFGLSSALIGGADIGRASFLAGAGRDRLQALLEELFLTDR